MAKHRHNHRTPLSDGLTVVKLGGSLIKSGDAAAHLKVVAKARVPVVLVAGGGAFADEVRRLQRTLQASDKAAHRMAILAMHQNALALADLQPELKPVETIADVRLALRSGRVPIWLPLKMCDRDRTIARDWSITSDGLAARLAERLGDCDVLVLKSRSVPATADAHALAAAGVVDPSFAEIVTRAELNWRIFGPGEEHEFAARVLAPRQHAIHVGKAYDHSVIYRSTSRQRRATGRR
ncbi:MAG: uridylate kinase [Alphaproteobacteria bacterium]|nr:uridylate kinase [Alphaproteobacteria bacterium]